MVKRSVYQASGTHRRLAMEVIDDMKLGKIVKQAGFRSGVGIAQDAVVVRWHAGARNVINGVTRISSPAQVQHTQSDRIDCRFAHDECFAIRRCVVWAWMGASVGRSWCAYGAFHACRG